MPSALLQANFIAHKTLLFSATVIVPTALILIVEKISMAYFLLPLSLQQQLKIRLKHCLAKYNPVPDGLSSFKVVETYYLL